MEIRVITQLRLTSAIWHTAAVLFTFVATCERHQVNPFTYLRDVLTRIAGHSSNRLAELLPDRWQPPPPPISSKIFPFHRNMQPMRPGSQFMGRGSPDAYDESIIWNV